MPTVRLKAGHVQPVWAGHPWVYAQAIDRVEGRPSPGDEVTVVDPRGNFLGRGFITPGSAIAVRILTRSTEGELGADFFRSRIERALRVRAEMGLPSSETSGYRLVHAEGDELSGLIVDRFDDVLSVQLLTAGMKRREAMVLDALSDLLRPRAIVDRTPATVAKLEGFQPGVGVVRGEQIDALAFVERNFRYRVPMDLGQKTGFYFDQRGLRARVEQLASERRVLDAYSFVGSFSMAAARGGARSVRAVDDSAAAVAAGELCAKENGFGERITFERGDARKVLEREEMAGAFDLVIVDPPRLSPTRSARDNALAAYSKVAELGCRATSVGGLVVVCSCSAAIDLNMLTRALAMGALRAGKQAFVLERHFQGADHPVNAAFPEGLYLKALVARVEER